MDAKKNNPNEASKTAVDRWGSEGNLSRRAIIENKQAQNVSNLYWVRKLLKAHGKDNAIRIVSQFTADTYPQKNFYRAALSYLNRLSK